MPVWLPLLLTVTVVDAGTAEPPSDGGASLEAASLAGAPAVGAAPASDVGSELDIFELETMFNAKTDVGTRSERTLDDVPGIITVVTRADIEALGAKSLSELLVMVPGFDALRVIPGTGQPVDSFAARGVRSDFGQTVLVLLNGKTKFNELVFASPWLSHRISADLIERIEVIRGPGSALYGGSAIAGVINVVTRDVAGPDGVEAKGFFGQNLQGSGYVLGKATFGSFTLGGQARVFGEVGQAFPSLATDRFYPNGVGGGVALSRPELLRDAVRPSLDLSVSLSGPKDLKVQAWYTHHTPAPFLTQLYPQPDLPQYHLKLGQLLTNAEITPLKGFRIALSYAFGYSNYRGLLSPSLNSSVAQDIRLDPRRAYSAADLFGTTLRSDDLSLDVSYTLTAGQHQLLFGLKGSRESAWGASATFWPAQWETNYRGPDAERTSTDPSEGKLAYPAHQRLSLAAYVQEQWQILDNLAVTGGVRYDVYSDIADFLILNPRAAVVWKPVTGHVLKAMYGQGFRPPSGFELNGIFSGTLRGTQGIRPERVYTAELSYITYLASQRLQVTGFYNHLRDGIVVVPSGRPNVPGSFGNVGFAHVGGFELELRGKWWWANYAFTYSQSSASGTQAFASTPLVTPHMFGAGVRYEVLPNLEASGQISVRSPRTSPSGGVSDTFVSLDARVEYTLKWFRIFARATNLLDQRFELPLVDTPYLAPYRGREFYVGLRFLWGQPQPDARAPTAD